MSTFDELAKLGPALSTFNQGEFRGEITQVDGKSITSGYCAGVCLDWMRRALLSSADRDQGFLGYEGTAGKGRTGKTVKRMGVGYKEQAPTYVSETNLKKAISILATLKNGIEKTYNFNGSHRTGVPISDAQAEVLMDLWVLTDDLDTTMSPAGVLSKGTLNNLYDQALQRQDPQKSARAASGRDWAHLADVLDDEFKSIRVAEGRQLTKKSFSSVKVRTSCQQKQYGSGGAWHAKLQADAFVPDCCTILSFSHNNGGGGHAVAVHVTGGRYQFFDPNFGAFQYTKEKLMHALQHLFWTPYSKAESDVLDGGKAVYLRRKNATAAIPELMNDVGYTIFERA